MEINIKGSQEEIRRVIRLLKEEIANSGVTLSASHLYEEKGIEGWMSLSELQFLYDTASKMKSVVEIGSWMGRSTHALLSSTSSPIIAIDTFKGSEDTNDLTNTIGKERDILSIFKENVGGFPNLEIMAMTSEEAAAKLEGQKFDMIFIDADHTYEGVKRDIELWKDKAEILICGHDYCPTWPGVVKAVRESFGEIDILSGSIWGKYLNK